MIWASEINREACHDALDGGPHGQWWHVRDGSPRESCKCRSCRVSRYEQRTARSWRPLLVTVERNGATITVATADFGYNGPPAFITAIDEYEPAE